MTQELEQNQRENSNNKFEATPEMIKEVLLRNKKQREEIKKMSGGFFNPKEGTYYVKLDLQDPDFGKYDPDRVFEKKNEKGEVIEKSKPRHMWLYPLYDISPGSTDPSKKLPWWVGSTLSAQIEACVEEGFSKLKIVRTGTTQKDTRYTIIGVN
jgi:hypothetical protein